MTIRHRSHTVCTRRTTIWLDDDLVLRFRETAHSRGQSLSAFLAEAGRTALGAKKTMAPPFIFRKPAPLHKALLFCEELRNRPQASILRPGARNWEIFQNLCRQVNAKGKN